ncbi:MAG: YdeI/OmpD-associated family protein [Gemmatimonadales bacterium]
MARSRTARPAPARFVARIYCVWINRYVDVPADAGPFTGAYVPVRATCNGAEFRGTLAPRGGGRYRLGLNAAVRRAAGGVDEGDDVIVTVRATTPHPIPALPRDLAEALAKAPGGRLAFEAWPPGRRRAILQWLNDAKAADTRARRVLTVLDRLGL